MVDELAQIRVGGRYLPVLLGIGLGLRGRHGPWRRGHLRGQPAEVIPVDQIAVLQEQPGEAADYHLVGLRLIILV